MKVTKGGLLLIIIIVILSAFVANVAQLIAIEVADGSHLPFSHNYPQHVEISDSTNDLLWFVQISDLHLSIFQDAERTIEFRDFCETTLSVIQPPVVLATGDLTDAKAKDNVGSRQFEAEWKKYGDILTACSQLKKTVWLDIRGNHDNFDVPGIFSDRNFYRRYSIQGKSHPRSYEYRLKKGNATYSFIGLDACPNQGLKRPFNFVGILQEKEMSEIERLAKSANSSDFTIWFGHYPTSCIWSHHPGVRALIGSVKGSIVYLCGHFHSLLGLVPQMYTIQKQGFYELELADWKDNRMFRVLAIDHGLLSFVDEKYNDWPIILITNPKHFQFQLFSKEPINSIVTSTHIRILVFSPSTVLSVMVKIDNKKWENCQATKIKNLYVLKWDPKAFESGLHTIEVSALDESGRQKVVKQKFSLDGSTSSFSILPRLILMLNFGSTLQLMFGLATACSVLPMCVLRYMNKTSQDQKNPFSSLRNRVIKNWIRRFWILSNIDRLFFPIVLYPIYIAIGPWCVGELIDGFTGVIFIWGIFVNGTFLPGSFTYGYGFIQLFLFQGPIVLFTALALDNRLFGERMRRRSGTVGYCVYASKHAPFVLILLSQVSMSYTFWLAYGTMSIIFGPMRLWPLLLTCWAWFTAYSVPLEKIKNTASVWTNAIDVSHTFSSPVT